MDRTKKLRVSPNWRAGRAAMKRDEEDPSQIQDTAERKKVQNRIAQRIYRERMKKRMEDLENFREASTAGLLDAAIPHTNPAALAGSKELDKQHFSPAASPPTPAAIAPPYTSRKRTHSSQSFPPTPPSPRGPSLAQSLQSESESLTAMIANSVDPTLLYKTSPDPPSNTMWDLSQAFSFGLEDVSSVSSIAPDPDLPMTPMSTTTTATLDLHPSASDPPSHHCTTIDADSDHPPNQNSDQKTALHIAASAGKTSTVQLLLSLNPDLLAQDSRGCTALHLAIHRNRCGVVGELIKTPQTPRLLEIRDGDGQTALHAAAVQGNEKAVASLLAAGADVEGKDGTGRTALMLAAEGGWDGVVSVLWKWGADVNAKMESSDRVVVA